MATDFSFVRDRDSLGFLTQTKPKRKQRRGHKSGARKKEAMSSFDVWCDGSENDSPPRGALETPSHAPTKALLGFYDDHSLVDDFAPSKRKFATAGTRRQFGLDLTNTALKSATSKVLFHKGSLLKADAGIGADKEQIDLMKPARAKMEVDCECEHLEEESIGSVESDVELFANGSEVSGEWRVQDLEPRWEQLIASAFHTLSVFKQTVEVNCFNYDASMNDAEASFEKLDEEDFCIFDDLELDALSPAMERFVSNDCDFQVFDTDNIPFVSVSC